MAKVLPFTEARAHLTELLDEVESVHEHVVITRNGRPAAVVMSHAEYDSLIQTLEILGDQKLMADLAASDNDVAPGCLIPWRRREARARACLTLSLHEASQTSELGEDGRRQHH